MGPWLLISSVAYGMLMLLDPLMYIYIAYSLNPSSLYLGICSALWSVAYISTSIALGPLGDRGRARLLMSLSLLAILLSYIAFIHLDYFTAMISYILHAVSISLATLAINSTVFDSFESDLWGRILLTIRIVGQGVRGGLMMLFSVLDFENIPLLLQITAIIMLCSLISMPSFIIIPERSFYRLFGLARNLSNYLKASTSILFIDRPSLAQTIFERIWNSIPKADSKRILAQIMITTCIGDYVLALIPLILKSYMDLNSMWLAYGITSISSIVIILLIKRVETCSTGVASVLMVIRSVVLLFGVTIVKNIAALVIYMIVTSTLYAIVDSILYNNYIIATGGYKPSTYYSLRELGSILGSVLGGYALSVGADFYIIAAIVLIVGHLPLFL